MIALLAILALGDLSLLAICGLVCAGPLLERM